MNCTSLTNITIPGSVTTVGDYAFSGCASLTRVEISDGVTSLGQAAFSGCISLNEVRIPHSVSNFGIWIFRGCTSLVHIEIPNSIRSIPAWAFSSRTSLTSVTIPARATSIGNGAFIDCPRLTAINFLGDAPGTAPDVFSRSEFVTIYYLPGTTGWEPDFAGRPTAWWILRGPVILTTPTTFGVQNGSFGFRISWATNASVAGDATADLEDSDWNPVSTNNLTDGWTQFIDPSWSNHPIRFYRIRSP